MDSPQGLVRRSRLPPRPTTDSSKEIGLKLLGPLSLAMAKRPEKSAAVLSATSELLSALPPLRMFKSLLPRCPPDEPLLVVDGMVATDSQRGGTGNWSVMNPFRARTSATQPIWSSRQRPPNAKSSITVVFKSPVSLAGIDVEMPELSVQAEWMGVEYLPSVSATSAGAGEAPAPAPAAWVPAIVVPCARLSRGGHATRLNIAPSGPVASLRLSFKGYAKANKDKYHGLAACAIRIVARRASPGVAAPLVFSDATAVLRSLEKWATATAAAAATDPAVAAAAPAGLPAADAPEAAPGIASVVMLQRLSLATGALSSVLSVVDLLAAHGDTPLPPVLSAATAAYVRALDLQYDTLGDLCEKAARGLALDDDGGAGGAGGSRTRDVLASCSFDLLSGVTAEAGGRRVRASGGGGDAFAVLNTGASSGKLEWEMRVVQDPRGGEATCFGIARRPVDDSSYESSDDLWLWRAYNGRLYSSAIRSSGEEKTTLKFHQGDLVRFELDLDARTLAGWVAGAPAGILFSDLPRGTMFYPAVQFYGDNRTSELVSCKLTLAGGAAEPKAGGGTAGVLPPLWLSDVEPVEFAAIAEVTAGGPVGRAEVAAAVAAAAARAPPATPDTGAAAATAEAVRTASTLSLHGVLVKHGLSTPLVGAAASSTHAATIRLDLGAVNRAAAKRARAESGASAEPRPYDSFEAVVGLADWVYPQVEALPTPGEAAAMHAAAAAAGAWGQWHAYDAHGPAAPAAAAAAAAAEVAAPRIPAASASLDADSKDDDSVLSAIAAPTPDSLPISAGGASGAATVVFRLFCATAGKSAAATPAVAAMRGSPLSAPSLHPHPLAFAASLPPEYAAMHPNMQGEMSCDVCTQTITKSFHCAACGFDVCEACAAKAAGGEAPREIWASPAIHVPAGGASSYAEFARLPLFRVQVPLPSDATHLTLRVERTSTGGRAPPPRVLPVWGDACLRSNGALRERVDFFAAAAGTAAAPLSQSAPPPAAAAAALPLGGSGQYDLPSLAVPPAAHTTALVAAAEGGAGGGGARALTGAEAAASVVRCLRLFSRVAYTAVRMTRPKPGFGDAPLPLELPFCVQVDGHVLAQLGATVRHAVDRLRSAPSSSSNLWAEVVTGLLQVARGNLRRLQASYVDPADVGVVLALPPPPPPAAAVAHPPRHPKQLNAAGLMSPQQQRTAAAAHARQLASQAQASDDEDEDAAMLRVAIEQSLLESEAAAVAAAVRATTAAAPAAVAAAPPPLPGASRGSGVSAAAAAAAAATGGAAAPHGGRRGSALARKPGTLTELHGVLLDVLKDGPAPYPLPLRAAAAAVLDSHQRLFYPSPAARQAFLAELLGGEAEGATLEVQFSWPTGIGGADAAAAVRAAAAAVKAGRAAPSAVPAAAAAGATAGEAPAQSDNASPSRARPRRRGGGGDGASLTYGSGSDGGGGDDDEDNSGPPGTEDSDDSSVRRRRRIRMRRDARRAAAARSGSAASSSAAAAPASSKSAAAAADLIDPRFERAVLLLQAHAASRGWRCGLAGVWGRFLHFVLSVPADPPAAPVTAFVSRDLRALLDAAGLPGWSFPEGCAEPDIACSVERHLAIDRAERLRTDPGVGWVRLFPARVGSFDAVMEGAQAFLRSLDPPPVQGGGAQAAGELLVGDGAAAEGAAAAAAVDVFGDPVGPDAVGASGGGRPGAGGGNDEEEEEEGDDDGTSFFGGEDDEEEEEEDDGGDDDDGEHHDDDGDGEDDAEEEEEEEEEDDDGEGGEEEEEEDEDGDEEEEHDDEEED